MKEHSHPDGESSSSILTNVALFSTGVMPAPYRLIGFFSSSCRSFGKMSKSASVSLGRGGIMIDSEAQRQAPRGEENGDVIQFGAGVADGERARGQGLVDEAKVLGGGEKSRRSALGEGASVGFEDERDGAISIARGGGDKAQ